VGWFAQRADPVDSERAAIHHGNHRIIHLPLPVGALRDIHLFDRSILSPGGKSDRVESALAAVHPLAGDDLLMLLRGRIIERAIDHYDQSDQCRDKC